MTGKLKREVLNYWKFPIVARIVISEVYVLYSVIKGRRFYVGMSNNVEKRLEDHNKKRVFSTKGYTPWTLLFYEKFDSRKGAREREKYLKSGSGKEKIKKILIP